MTDQLENEIIHRELDPGGNNPAIQIVETIMRLEEVDSTELPTIYDCVDGMLDELFSNPPSPSAQMELQFSYHSYRITIEQNGNARFVKIK